MTTTMAAIPPHERPRERLLSSGREGLSERELLALVLRNGTRGTSALDLAGELLSEYGGLSALMEAQPEELAARSGIGIAKAAALVGAFELRRRAANEEPQKALRSAEDVAQIAIKELDGLRRERMIVLVCDAANRLRRTVTVSEGSIDSSLAPIREILNAVLRHDGRAFAIAHNHPGGDAGPSDADCRATAELENAASVVRVRFLGHVVVARERWQLVPRRRPRTIR